MSLVVFCWFDFPLGTWLRPSVRLPPWSAISGPDLVEAVMVQMSVYDLLDHPGDIAAWGEHGLSLAAMTIEQTCKSVCAYRP